MNKLLLVGLTVLSAAACSSSTLNAATLISLSGGGPGEGFSPLAVNAGSFNVDGGSTIIQGITFSGSPSASNPNGTSTGGYNFGATPATFGWSSPTTDDDNMASLLQGFQYVGGGTVFDFSPGGAYIEFSLTGLTVGQSYQLDLFTVADSGARNTNFQIIGSSTFQDTVLSDVTPMIVQYSLTPDAFGNIAIRYGFGGDPLSTGGNAGLLSGVAITTVPEPSSLFLMGIGGCVLLALLRRKARLAARS